MRIAICFSGAIRSFHTCMPSIKKYFISSLEKNNQVDIFLHLWDLNEDTVNKLNLDIDFKMRPSRYDPLEFMFQLKPIRYKIDIFNNKTEKIPIKELLMENSSFKNKNYAHNAIGMYYKIFYCNELKKIYEQQHNFKYDFVFRARLDFIFEKELNDNMFDNFKNQNILYLIKDRYATRSKKITNDKFWGGSSNIIDKMSSIYLNIPKYYNKIDIEGQTLTENFIKDNKIPTKMIGDEFIYYKCLGRHEIKNRGITIKLYNLPSNINFYLAYCLLYDGYNVIADFNPLLTYFQNYKTTGEGTRVIITSTPRIEDLKTGYKKRILYGTKIIPKYITIDNKLNNDQTTNIVKFIISLIKFNTHIEYFKFDTMNKINISNNEEVKYLIPDKGYKPAKVQIINKKYYCDNILVSRETLTIFNKIKYYKEGILPID